MLGFISGLTKVIAKTTIALPVAVVADVITGRVFDHRRTYTGKTIEAVGDAVEEMIDD